MSRRKAVTTDSDDDDNWGEERREVNANLQEDLEDDAPAMKQRGGWTEEETRLEELCQIATVMLIYPVGRHEKARQR